MIATCKPKLNQISVRFQFPKQIARENLRLHDHPQYSCRAAKKLLRGGTISRVFPLNKSVFQSIRPFSKIDSERLTA